VTSVAFSPDGKTVASGSEDNSVWVWDVQTGTALHTLATLSWEMPYGVLVGSLTGVQKPRESLKRGIIRKGYGGNREQIAMIAEKSPEALLSWRQPEGQGRALRGSVIAGIPQT
jgi:WD40 repeat protein